MEEYSIWFYLGIYFSGVAVAVLFHKVFFRLHPEFVYENQSKTRREINQIKKGLESNGTSFKEECSYIANDDDDVFSPINDQEIKMFIWLSWFTVLIWFVAVVLKIFLSVFDFIGKCLSIITNKIV